MKNFLFFLFLLPILLTAQTSELSNTFVQVKEVDIPPVFPGCEEESFEECSLAKITSLLVENIDRSLLQNLDPEESKVGLKFIIDSSGKVRRVIARGKNEQLKEEYTQILNNLPNFTPGEHHGEKVNVIVDIPLMLKEEEKEKLYDIPAMSVDCRENAEPKNCTSRSVQKYINKNFKISRVKLKMGVVEKVVFHFIIDENGMVQEVTAEGSNESLKKEGMKVISKLPAFLPAMKDGKNIKTSYSLPITLFKSQ